MGLSMVAAGWAIVTRKLMPALLGWLALVAGALTVLTVLAPDTPLSTLAGMVFMPSLLLAIAFRIWAGIALIRRVADPVRPVPPAEAGKPSRA